jgi:hypothetical protein
VRRTPAPSDSLRCSFCHKSQDIVSSLLSIRLPYYFTLLAETFGRAGLVGETLASLSTGFAFASKNGEEWAVAELHRVQGICWPLKESPNRRAPASGGASRQRGVGFAGVRAKIVDSCAWNGRNHLYRTLLERHAGQSKYIRRAK